MQTPPISTSTASDQFRQSLSNLRSNLMRIKDEQQDAARQAEEQRRQMEQFALEQHRAKIDAIEVQIKTRKAELDEAEATLSEFRSLAQTTEVERNTKQLNQLISRTRECISELQRQKRHLEEQPPLSADKITAEKKVSVEVAREPPTWQIDFTESEIEIAKRLIAYGQAEGKGYTIPVRATGEKVTAGDQHIPVYRCAFYQVMDCCSGEHTTSSYAIVNNTGKVAIVGVCPTWIKLVRRVNTETIVGKYSHELRFTSNYHVAVEQLEKQKKFFQHGANAQQLPMNAQEQARRAAERAERDRKRSEKAEKDRQLREKMRGQTNGGGNKNKTKK